MNNIEEPPKENPINPVEPPKEEAGETDWTEWEGVPDLAKLTKEEKYDRLMESRARTIAKYHKSQKGREARARASTKYYTNNKEKILQRKREKYAQRNMANKNGKKLPVKPVFHSKNWKAEI